MYTLAGGGRPTELGCVAAAVGVLAAAAWVRPWRHCNVMRKNFVSEELYAELFAIDQERGALVFSPQLDRGL